LLGEAASTRTPLERGAGERLQPPGDHIGKRAFARSVRPDESMDVAAPDREVDVAQRPESGPITHLAEILTHLKAQGVTMIIIEHQTRFLFPLCDRVTVLNAGEVILTGTAEEVRAHPVVRQVYLGE
jgi:ABC-type cobalamin transport system ATPase subunit